MCSFVNADGKQCMAKGTAEFCRRHQPAVDEPTVESINIEQNNVATYIDEATSTTMPPQQRDDMSIAMITDNSEKQRIFTYSVIGNVNLAFDNGKK